MFNASDEGESLGFSRATIASVSILFLAVVLGAASVLKFYDAAATFDGAVASGDDPSQYAAYSRDVSVAIGTGVTSQILFAVSIMLVFFAGMRNRRRCEKGQHPCYCCLSACVIAGWIVFMMTFMMNFIVLMLAFNEENKMLPGAPLSGFVGNVISWAFMYGYAELSRR